MKIKSEFKNSLLKRKEIIFSVVEHSNPGFVKMQNLSAEHYKVGVENVVVKKLWNNFGNNEFFCEVFVYESTNDKDKVEPKIKIKKEVKA